MTFKGPAIIEDSGATIVVHPGNSVEIDGYGNIHILAACLGARHETELLNDPITLEIIQNSLQAAADEMFAAMKKTAMSSIIYEVLDMGTGITDARARLASSGAGIPAFIGVLDKSVQGASCRNSTSPATSSPATCSRPTIPITAASRISTTSSSTMPVFAGGRIIAWTANHRAQFRCRRHVAGLALGRRDRDFSGGPAAARDQDDLEGRADHAPCWTS